MVGGDAFVKNVKQRKTDLRQENGPPNKKKNPHNIQRRPNYTLPQKVVVAGEAKQKLLGVTKRNGTPK